MPVPDGKRLDEVLDFNSGLKVTPETLKELDRFVGRPFTGPTEIDDFFALYNVKFAAGHWCAGPFSDRFTFGGSYQGNPAQLEEFFTSVIEDKDLAQRAKDAGVLAVIAQISRIAKAGITGIEFHEAIFLDDNYQPNENKINIIKEALSYYHVKPTNMNTNLFSDPKWGLGGVTNADEATRKEALRVAIQGVDIAKNLRCTSVALWPGSDGWDYNFQVDYTDINKLFLDACVEINKAAVSAGLPFGIEAKLKEPREMHMIISNTYKAIALAKAVNMICGKNNMGVAVDYGHEMMSGNEPADVIEYAALMGVPIANFHLNNANFKNNDEDRVTGTGDIFKSTDFVHSAVKIGYIGWFGLDQFTYRSDPTEAMAMARELFAEQLKKALVIYRNSEALKTAQKTGDDMAALRVVKDKIYHA